MYNTTVLSPPGRDLNSNLTFLFAIVSRCISSALFLSEGTRRNAEILLCFPEKDHFRLVSMREVRILALAPWRMFESGMMTDFERCTPPHNKYFRIVPKRLQKKKKRTRTAEEEGEAEEDMVPSEAVAGDSEAELQSPGWIVVKVSGDGIRHLKPDERSIAAVLRHFLYADECAGKNDHSCLLASEGLLAVKVLQKVSIPTQVLRDKFGVRHLSDYECVTDGSDSLEVSEICKASGTTNAGDTAESFTGWRSLPAKKCCKGISYRQVASLRSVVPPSGTVSTTLQESLPPSPLSSGHVQDSNLTFKLEPM
eukprot:9497965-Pyramimonas_sp.AAC.1